MAKWLIDSGTLTDIADAIREKKGTIAPIAVDELADEVASISSEPNLKLRMTFNNETPASADGTIYLEANDSMYDGTYDIFWGDDNGVMSNYSKIESVSIAVADAKPMAFVKLNPFNAIPKYATRICAVRNNAIAVSFDIPSAKLWGAGNYGEHLYSFGLLSDAHVQYQTAHDDVRVAMTYLNEREGVDAICITGDLTSDGSVAHIEEWKTDRDTWADNTPVYACNGNHEGYTDSSIMVTSPNSIRKYLDSDYTEETGAPYFYKVINNDVFVFVATFEGTRPYYYNTMFSENCLSWLEDLLETYRNQRVFLFSHIPPHAKHTHYSGFGTGNFAYSYDLWSGSDYYEDKNTFLSLLAHYKNVLWFSGHSHIKYEYQRIWERLNVDRYKTGARFVHVSSLAAPRDIIDGSATDYIYAESEGAVVDVYANCIRVRNRNFVGEKFYGLCEYLFDTTPEIIPPAAKTVVSISATKTKTQYTTTDTLNTDDITVTALYSDSSTANVTSGCVIDTSAVTLSSAGTYTIGISYTYEGDTVTTSLQVTSTQVQQIYNVIFDASFDGTMSTIGSYFSGTVTANNANTVAASDGAYIDSNDHPSVRNKPLYYRLIGTTGISLTEKTGFRAGTNDTRATGTWTEATKVGDYWLTSTEWMPLEYGTSHEQIALSNEADHSVFSCSIKASSSSTATFPVTVNTRIQVAYLSDVTVMLDATFNGTISSKGDYVAPTANNETTIVNGNHAYSTTSAMQGKPLYYKFVSDTGVDNTHKVGVLCGTGASYTAFTNKVTDYSIDATDWTPLIVTNTADTPLEADATNYVLHCNFKSSGSSTATFPVTVNTRIQIGYAE